MHDLVVPRGVTHPESPAISVKVVAVEENQKGECISGAPFDFGKDEEEILFLP